MVQISWGCLALLHVVPIAQTKSNLLVTHEVDIGISLKHKVIDLGTTVAYIALPCYLSTSRTLAELQIIVFLEVDWFKFTAVLVYR